MKTVGEILSQERKRKNISLEEVETSTRIRKKVLESLEKGDWKNLPSATFVKGLIKNYGKYLGLEEKELLAFYRREFDERNQPKKVIVTKSVKGSRWRLTPQLATFGVVAAAVVLIIGYLFFQYQSFTGPPMLNLTEPKDNTKVNSLEVNLVGTTWEDALLKVNGQDVSLSPGGTFSLSVGLNPGINTLTVTAANRFGKISTEKRTIVADVSDKTQSSDTSQPLSLIIKVAPESVNLTIEVDGQKTFDGVLVAGTEKIIKATQRIKVHTRNGGSTQVIYSGNTETLGKPGEEIEKVYQLPISSGT